MSVLGALAVVGAGCAPISSETAAVVTTSTPSVSRPAPTVEPTPHLTPRPTASPGPTPTPLPSPHYLTGNAYDFRDVLRDHQNFACPDIDRTAQLLWTCSLGDVATISFFGPSPAKVCAIRVETSVGDPGDWMRPYASIVGTEVHSWVDARIQGDTLLDETENIGGVRVRTAHDEESDSLLMSIEPDCR